MNIVDYQDYVEKLASPQSVETEKDRLLTSALGLAGEAGECADLVKKHIYHGKEFKREDFIKELSDVMWYMAFACNTLGITIQDVIDVNVEKLNSRYKDGKFTLEEFKAKEDAKLANS